MAKAKKTTKKPATKGDVLTDPVRNDGSAERERFKELAEHLIPTEKDEWRVNELATMLRDGCGLIAKHWKDVNRIADKSDEKTLQFAMGFSSIRKSFPPQTSVGISFSESYRDRVKSPVPDPTQMEFADAAEASAKLAEEASSEVAAGAD